MWAWSSPSVSFLITPGLAGVPGAISTWGRAAYRSSMEPYRWTRAMAVFSPTPFTPGMLSLESPMRAFRSMMWMGSKPYSSRKASGVMSRVVVRPMRVDTSFTVVVSVTSWRESLSPVTMTVSHPAAVSFSEMVPMRSSASQPSSSYMGMFMAASTSLSRGSWLANSSGIPFRVAL